MGKTLKIDIGGMNCDHCVQTLEKGLRSVPGVEGVRVSLKERQALLEVVKTSDELSRELQTKIEDLGYEVRGIAA